MSKNPQSINFFYNVKYDTNAIIKLLPDNHIEIAIRVVEDEKRIISYSI